MREVARAGGGDDRDRVERGLAAIAESVEEVDEKRIGVGRDLREEGRRDDRYDRRQRDAARDHDQLHVDALRVVRDQAGRHIT